MGSSRLLRPDVDLRHCLWRPAAIPDDAVGSRSRGMVLSRGRVPRPEGVPGAPARDEIPQLLTGVPEHHRLLPPARVHGGFPCRVRRPHRDRQMVLTLLRGLGGKFRHMVSILKMHRPFPMFAEARTHLLLEEMEIDARPPSPPSALVAATPRPVAPGAPAPPRPGAPPPTRPQRPPAANVLVVVAAAADAEPNRANRLILVALLQADKVLHPLACIHPLRTHGQVLYRCGHMTSPPARHHLRLRSAPFHSTAASAAPPAPMVEPTVPHLLRTTRSTGDLHHQCFRRPHQRTRQRPGTLLTAGHGIRTP